MADLRKPAPRPTVPRTRQPLSPQVAPPQSASPKPPPRRPGMPSSAATEQPEASEQTGFYAPAFQPAELQALAALENAGLAQEIDMLRVYTRRVFELASGVDDLDKAINALRALGISAARLSTLLQAQARLGQRQSDARNAIARALQQTLKELRLLEAAALRR